MAAKTDITGQRFGKLVAINRAPPRKGQNFWRFRCDCGREKEVRRCHVTGGRTASCGCAMGSFTHGLAHTRVWQTWKSMKQRCNNPNGVAFHRYGGRGITYCSEWELFEPFLQWALAAGYADDLELDRIDNDGNYTPENCQFISHRENSQKTGSVRMIAAGGREEPLFEAARRHGLEVNTVKTRLRRGWSLDEAFQPSKIPRKARA